MDRGSYTTKFDFHIHSIYSNDSWVSPHKICKIARMQGLSGIAVTDHNSIEGALKARDFAAEDLLVIIGCEIKTDSGELIGLFLNKGIKSSNFMEVVDEIKDQDGLIVLPHAYKNKQKDPEKLIKQVDVIECPNARTSSKLNLKASILSEKYKLPRISGSDAHLPLEIGRVVTCFPYSSLECEEVRKLVINGQRKITGCESPYALRMLSMFLGKCRKKLKKSD